jgi:phospholipid transport system substrate-binding protein
MGSASIMKKMKKMKNKMKIIGLIIIFLLTAGSVSAGEPMTALKKSLDLAMSILNDPQYNTDDLKEIQKEKIWEIIRQIFDFTEIAKRALAANWKKFSPQERKLFTESFTELLGNSYLEKIQSGFQDETIAYLSEDQITDTKFMIKTKIISKNGEIPVNYNMRKKKSEWRIYDVKIEGVSLVKNYRTQFNKILFRESPTQLIETIQNKVQDQKNKKKEKASFRQFYCSILKSLKSSQAHAAHTYFPDGWLKGMTETRNILSGVYLKNRNI